MTTKEKEIYLNREQRRTMSKKYNIKADAMPTVNKGPCKYCGEKVYIASGQLYTMIGGMPTHKRCRP